MRTCALLVTLTAIGCSSNPAAPTSSDAGLDPLDASGESAPDASVDANDASIDKSAACASTFGQAIGTVGFARFDGTVVAIVPPGHPTCAEKNSTHLVLQIQVADKEVKLYAVKK